MTIRTIVEEHFWWPHALGVFESHNSRKSLRNCSDDPTLTTEARPVYFLDKGERGVSAYQDLKDLVFLEQRQQKILRAYRPDVSRMLLTLLMAVPVYGVSRVVSNMLVVSSFEQKATGLKKVSRKKRPHDVRSRMVFDADAHSRRVKWHSTAETNRECILRDATVACVRRDFNIALLSLGLASRRIG